MSDELDELLAGTDGARAMPLGLRERLERSVLDWRHAPASTDHPALAGVDAPRAVPQPLRTKLEGAVSTAEVSFYEGLDAPRPLPSDVRASIERALMPDRVAAAGRGARVAGVGRLAAPLSRAVARRALGLVATLLLATSSLAVVFHGTSPDAPTRALPAEAPGTTDVGGGIAVPPGGTQAPPIAVPLGGALFPGRSSGSGAIDTAEPPPFSGLPAFASAPSLGTNGSGASSGPAEAPPPSAPIPALRVGLIGGDAGASAGFRAYMELVNGRGGVRGHALAINAATAWTSAPLVTVNLSTASIAADPPSGTHGPLLDAISAPESALRGDVYGFSTPPERQAHLIADAVFPSASAGRTAVIYTGSGVFASLVPDAIQAVLDARGVRTVARVSYDGRATLPVPADVAFLSLDAPSARDWFRQMDESIYGLGVAGIYSLVDAAELGDMPSSGVRAISPYELPANTDEARALRDGTKMPLSDSVIHGWVTAKALAVALYQSSATTAAELRRALDALRGYSPGFMPAYDVRPGTHARTPEGILYQVTGGTFARTDTTWRRDPF